MNITFHKQIINNNKTNTQQQQNTGKYFNLPGHSLLDLSIVIQVKVRSSDDMYRKEQEKHLIRKLNTY